jgi:putative transposase
MNDQGNPSPLTPEGRQALYTACRVSPVNAKRIELMVQGSGKRDVGKGALNNVKTIFTSRKCGGASRVNESHTVEQLFAYECELDRTVVGYYCQVPCTGIIRTTSRGRRHVSSATLDFLVFRADSITLVECKARSWLEKEAEKPESPWHRSNGTWINSALSQHADELDITFQAYAAPEPPAIYKQNLEACYAARWLSLTDAENRVMSQVVSRIARGGTTLATLYDEVEGFDSRLAVAMLGKGLAFAPLRSCPLKDANRMVLYPEKDRAYGHDMRGLDVLREQLQQPRGLSAVSRASAAAYRVAVRRASIVTEIALGTIRGSGKMRALTARVMQQVENGSDLVECCIPAYKNSGNRTARLTADQQELVRFAVEEIWNKGKARTPLDVYLKMVSEAGLRGIAPVGKTTLYRAIEAAGKSGNALHLRGMRGYQAARDRGDPCFKTLPPLAYGHTIHIDSSRFDSRIAPQLMDRLPAPYATFYVAIDAQSTECMAYAFIFGPARTDGLALLLRDLVRRHGRLPMMVHVDRGAENLSRWALDFFAGYSSIRVSPTAGSAWNGLAENLIREVNQQVADKTPGNTRNDKEGRGADGRHKSAKQMKLDFLTIIQQVEAYLFADLPRLRRSTGMTPTDHREEAIEAFGLVGFPVAYDEDFLYRTSVPIELKKSAVEGNGIRLSEGLYSTPDLLMKLRTCKVQEIRIDPASIAYIYVRIDGLILKAFRSDAVALIAQPTSESLFTRLAQACMAVVARRENGAITKERHDRMTFAKMVARPDNAPAANDPEPVSGLPDKSPIDDAGYQPLDWDLLDGFEEVP